MSNLTTAQQALSRGDWSAARHLLQNILRAEPRSTEGLYLLGVCEQAAGNASTAEQTLRQLLLIEHGHFGGHYSLGLLLSAQGRDHEALVHHDQAVALQPQQIWAYVNRGNARARLKQYTTAIEDFQHALELQGNLPEVHTNLGNALRETGRLDEALLAHEQALRLRSNFTNAWVNRAGVLLALKRPEDALQSAEEALKHTPESASAWSARGAALLALKRRPESLQSYERATQLVPSFHEAWHQRGNVLAEMNRPKEALASYARAIELDSSSALSWFYHGMTQIDLKDHASAVKSYEKAWALNPNLDRLAGAYMRLRTSLCDWREFGPWQDRLIEGLRQGRSIGTPLGITSVLDDPAALHQAARIFTQQLHPSSTRLGPPRARSRDKGRIRLGYYSADFRTHPVSMLLAELLERHDRSRFELVGFAFQPNPGDPMTERLARAFGSFVEIRDRSDQEVARLSRDMGIDIAINLGGYTDGHRTDIFAMRAAPVQVSYLGYAGTMGAAYMDYLIADSTACPPESDMYYDEKIARLPHSFMPRDTTQAVADVRLARSDFGLPADSFVFCCFNNHFKITPQMFDIWMRLLHAAPGSVLWLSDTNDLVKANLAREAAVRGVEPGRIIYARRVDSMAEHLTRYRLADLFLDTLPYNAHTTASDALWAGVPVLTCAGRTFAARVAASLLTAAGLPELITDSLESYEKLALDLVRDAPRLSLLRNRLETCRETSPLFNTPQLAHDLERAYAHMHARATQGLPPEAFTLNPV